jgi:alginate O-acetyltransferase complex protein AlgI
MPFNAPLFLFVFTPVFFAVYHRLPRDWRNRWALAASLAFYGWAEPRFLLVVVASGLLDWALGRAAHQNRSEKSANWCVRIAVITNLGLLGYFKYAGFFVENVSAAFARLGFNPIPVPEVALPLGISFVVFQKITYVIDIRRGTGPPARSFADYLLYVTLFPQLIAGPIVKYHDIADQLRQRDDGFANFRDGLIRFVWGLGKKVLVADVVATYANAAFVEGGGLATTAAWLGIMCYAVQIYFDFSGYSDMAIGLARMMGFRLRENFEQPYISQNFTEFWRRWHISLSTWIRDYLYFPLGGNRRGAARGYLNLFICFVLSGLWHGASWTFLVWGLYHGFFMTLDRLFWLDLQRHVPRFLNVALTFILVLFGWVLFRAESFGLAWGYLGTLWGRGAGTISPYMDREVLFMMLLGLAIAFAPLLPRLDRVWGSFNEGRRSREVLLALSLMVLLVVFGRVAVDSFSPFIYFRF